MTALSPVSTIPSADQLMGRFEYSQQMGEQPGVEIPPAEEPRFVGLAQRLLQEIDRMVDAIARPAAEAGLLLKANPSPRFEADTRSFPARDRTAVLHLWNLSLGYGMAIDATYQVRSSLMNGRYPVVDAERLPWGDLGSPSAKGSPIDWRGAIEVRPLLWAHLSAELAERRGREPEVGLDGRILSASADEEWMQLKMIEGALLSCLIGSPMVVPLGGQCPLRTPDEWITVRERRRFRHPVVLLDLVRECLRRASYEATSAIHPSPGVAHLRVNFDRSEAA